MGKVLMDQELILGHEFASDIPGKIKLFIPQSKQSQRDTPLVMIANGTLPKRGQNLMDAKTVEENGYQYLMIFLTKNQNFRQHGSPGTGGVSEKLADGEKRLSKSGVGIRDSSNVTRNERVQFLPTRDSTG